MDNKPRLKGNKGFLLIEILIAGIIITASIAATMSLFRVGYQHLGRVNVSNKLSSKLAQSVSFLKAIDPEKKEGIEELGDGVTLVWESKVLEHVKLMNVTFGETSPSNHELFLYKMDFQLVYNEVERDYELNILRHKTKNSSIIKSLEF